MKQPRTLWSTLCLLIAVSLLGCSTTTPEGLGDQALEKGEYTKALRHYEEGLKSNPKDFALQLKYASALEGAGKMDRALAAYSELIRQYPKEPLPRLYRARLLVKMNDEVTALKDLDRLLTSYKLTVPQKILALGLEGEIHYRQEDLKEAERSFLDALALAEENPAFKATYHYRNLLHNTARVAFALGNFERARELFQKYLERKKLNGLSPTQDDYYFYTLVLKYNGNFDEAQEYESKLAPEYRARLEQEIQR